MALQFEHGHRCPSGYRDRTAGRVDSDEDDRTLRSLNVVGARRATAAPVGKDVHAAPPGVGKLGLYLDLFPDGDGPVEMQGTDRRHDAAAATPLSGGGVAGMVDPFEQRAGV